MKKRILSFFLAVITVMQIVPWTMLPIIAEGEETADAISIEDMEVGKLYTAVWDYSEYDEFVPYKVVAPTDGSEGGLEWKGFWDDVDYNDAFVLKENFPQELTVRRDDATDTYGVYVTNYDWPAEYNDYRYVDIVDLIITGEYVEPEDDGYIYGKVDIDCDEAVGNTVTLDEGEKLYAFTSLDAEISENVKYQWQIKLEDGRWAIIGDYVYPYAVLSAALLVNAPGSVANIRCVVIDGNKKYASDELALRAKPTSGNTEQLLSASFTVDSSYNATPFSMQKLSSEIELLAEVEEAFQIAINYVYARKNEDNNHENAYTPFIVSLSGNETFNSVVNSPFIIGYTACVLTEDTTNPNAIEFEGQYYLPQPSWKFESVGVNDTEKQKVTIYYVPQKTNFIVEHYYQNLQDDGYSLAGMDVVKTKYSDEEVGEGLARDAYGFTPLFYDTKTTVSGNGNTVIEIYYDRIYYLVDFDLADGYGLMPYYVRYETQVMLTEPTRPGYSFVNPWELTRVYTKKNDDDKVGTDLDKNDAEISAAYANKNANTIITVKHNLDYKANWKAETTSYTIIYWIENADDDKFTLDSFKVVEGVAPGATVSASDSWTDSEKSYFTYNDKLSDHNVVVKGDGTTAVNVYYLRNYYNLIFKASKPCEQPEHTHDAVCQATCALEVHQHSDACGVASQTCGMEEHIHVKELLANGGCLSCTITEHTTHTVECINCGLTEHTAHSTSCYSNVGNQYESNWYDAPNGAPSDPEEGEVFQRYNGYGTKYIYVNGEWYEYSGTTSSGNTATLTCQGIHSHIDSCYKDTLHTHSEACYGCTKEEHVHTTLCYTYMCGEVAHSHLGSCFSGCQIPAHTHSTTCSGTSSKNVLTIRRKYDASLVDIWTNTDTSKVPYQGTCLWQSNKRGDNGSYPYYAFLQKMPGYSSDLVLTYVAQDATYTYRWDYALEKLSPETSYDGKTEIQSNNRYYFVDFTSVLGYNSTGLSLTYNEDYFPITGFSQRDTTVPSFTNAGNRVYTATLFYTRNSYSLKFHDGVNEITSKAETVLFEGDISKKSFIPNTPTGKESGSVRFVGWYTTPACADGTEFSFEGQIMPAHDLTLYAKWEPTEHNVKVYRQESEIGSTVTGELLLDKTVEFGTQVLESELAEYAKPNANYVFAGWFYKDENGEESRYDFNTMVVKHSYEIYAKWTKNVPIPYTVKYVTTVDGVEVEIAEADSGIALEGVKKTFTAKTGADLTPPYHEWYFPKDRYITFEMSANAEENVVKFVYETTDSLTYTISHVFTSEDFKTYFDGNDTFTFNTTHTITKGKDAFQATITEKFNDLVNETSIKKAANAAVEAVGGSLSNSAQNDVWNIVKDLTPDYYTQELHLVIDDIPDDDINPNVLTFTWEDSGSTTMYQVVHYVQNKDQSTYAVYSTEGYIVSNVPGTNYSAEWMEIYGFTQNTEDSKVSGKLPADDSLEGLVLELYYDRAKYEYTVHHYVVGTTTVLSSDETKQAYFEQEILVSDLAKDINGHVLYNGSTKHTIGSADYEITVFYSPMQVTFRYQEAIAGRGVLSRIEDYAGHVGIVPEDEAACTATAKDGYRFVGWFLDAGATQTVVSGTLATLSDDGATILPITPTADMANQTITFYALFEPTTRVFKNAGVVDADQAFIYHIKGNGTGNANVDVTFVITGNGEVTLAMLPYGDYTITVQSWAWRYGLPNGQDTNSWIITINNTDPFVFEYSSTPNNQWLTGDTYGSITP